MEFQNLVAIFQMDKNAAQEDFSSHLPKPLFLHLYTEGLN